MITKLLPGGWAASCHVTATALGCLAKGPLIGCVLSLCVASASGQDNPFGSGGAAPDDPPAAVNPQVGETDKVEEQDPLVRAIDNLQPSTPEDLMRATQAVMNLRRADVAKRYLKQLLDSNPAPQALADLQRRFGSALFLRMSVEEALQPEGAAVARAVVDAADQLNRNQQRLAELVQRLLSAPPESQGPFLVELKRAGAAAATPLIHVLADPRQEEQHRTARAALVALDQSVVDPLIASLAAGDPLLLVQVMDVLGHLKCREAAPQLLEPALSADSSREVQQAAQQALQRILGGLPTLEEAERFLTKRMESYLAGDYPARVDDANLVSRWVWNDEQKSPELLRLPAADASFLAAAEMAHARSAIASDNAEYTRMNLATSLESAKRLIGFDRPLPGGAGSERDAAAAVGSDTLEQVLDLSLQKQMHGAAIAVLEILADVGDASLLEDPVGKPRPVALALLDADRRVRFATARAIVGWNPDKAYPGSSRLPEVLGFLAATGGRRRVLVGHPRVDIAQTIAGQFAQLGFEVDTVNTGRQAILQATESPDYAFAILSDALDGPRFSDIIQQLRKDSRTAALPIGLAARDVNRQRADWLAEDDSLTQVFALPLQLEDAAYDTRRLLAAAGRAQMPQAERLQQAGFALDALARYAERAEDYPFYDVFRQQEQMNHALATPELSTRAARVLGFLGTPDAQQRLVQFASEPSRPIADRRAAAEAFKVAIQRRGLLLTRGDVMHQYDLHNQSENLDQGTQQILGLLLDAMEAPLQTTADQQPGH